MTDTVGIEARLARLEAQIAAGMSGIGALAAMLGDLKLLIQTLQDEQTKRLFGTDGTGDPGIAEEVIERLQRLEPAECIGALEGCRVVSPFRRK